MASSVNPQIILCDLSLPGMRGTHLAAELRKSPATRGAVIAILTARSDAELEPYREQASRLGVDLFLSKPLTDERLRKVLAKHRSRITS